MKQLNLKFFIPESTDGVFRHVYQKSIEKGIGSKVELICYITMASDVSTADLANVSTFTWNSILETFENYDGAALPAVKKSLRNGINKAQEILKNNKEIVKKGVDFEISLIAFIDGNMYLALIGDHMINLFRNDEVHLISEMLSSHQVNSGSVAVFPSDVVAITDSSKSFDWESPRALLTDLDEKLIDRDLESGTIFVSEQVDFTELIGLVTEDSPYDLTNLVEDEADEVEDMIEEEFVNEVKDLSKEGFQKGSLEETKNNQESKSFNEIEDNNQIKIDKNLEVKNEDEIEFKGKSDLEVDDISQENEITSVGSKNEKISQMTNKFKDTAKLISPIIQKTKNVLQKVWTFFITYITKVMEFLSRSFHSISKLFEISLSKKFGNQSWFKRIQAKISQNELGNNPSLGRIKMGGLNTSELRNKRASILIAIVIGIIVIIVGINKTKEAKLTKEIHEGYISYETKVTNYITTAESKLNSDSEGALLSLFEANQLVNTPTIDMTVISADDKDNFKKLKSKILSVEDVLYNRTAITQESGMELFVDGKLKFGDTTDATDIAIYKDPTQVEYLYVTDKGLDALFWITTAGKVKMVENNNVDIKDPLFVDTGAMGIYIYDKKLGAIRAPFDGNSGAVTGLVQLSGVSADAFGVDDPKEMAIFTNLDNVYVLSQSGQSIMKSQGSISTAYGLPYTYFSDDSLNTVTDIFGDLMIYLLTAGSDGLGTYQYNTLEGRFKSKDVQIIAPEQPFENLTAGYTAGTMDKHLYVFDSATKRILVFEKPMDDLHQNALLFLKEYVYRGDDEGIWSNVRDIVVDSAEANLYLLDGSNIWKVPL